MRSVRSVTLSALNWPNTWSGVTGIEPAQPARKNAIRAFGDQAKSCSSPARSTDSLSANDRQSLRFTVAVCTVIARPGRGGQLPKRLRRQRDSGTVRQLPSGKWQTSVLQAGGRYVSLGAFATRADADREVTVALAAHISGASGRVPDPASGGTSTLADASRGVSRTSAPGRSQSASLRTRHRGGQRRASRSSSPGSRPNMSGRPCNPFRTS